MDNEPKEYTFYKHEGCNKLHFTPGEIRRCAKTWIHFDQIEIVTLVEKERVKDDERSS